MYRQSLSDELSAVYLKYEFRVTPTWHTACVSHSSSVISLFYLSIRAGPIIGTSLNITFVPFRRRVLVDKPSFNV